jgi:hypothetical protein
LFSKFKAVPAKGGLFAIRKTTWEITDLKLGKSAFSRIENSFIFNVPKKTNRKSNFYENQIKTSIRKKAFIKYPYQNSILPFDGRNLLKV